MAKSQETLKRIMTLLNMDVALAQETLENGTVIEADEFVAGAEVFIVTEDGEKVALPVGEYAMAEGKILQVTEEGIIYGIVDAEAPAEEAPAEEVEASEDEEKEAPAEQLNYVTKEELAQVVDEIKMMVEEIVKEMAEDVVEDKKEEEVAMSKKPARKPMRHKPEAKTAKPLDLGKANKSGSTLDRVMAKLAQ
jgi:hypothetical protein